MKNEHSNTISRSGSVNALVYFCLIVVITGCVICVVGPKCAYSGDRPPDTADWIGYQHSFHSVSFRHPKQIQVSADSTGLITLRHSIPCVHNDPCYFMDDPVEPLSELTDFSVTVQLVPYDLATAIAHDAFLAAEMPEIMKPGRLEAVKAGDLLGYRSYQGAEGCGDYTHYFPWTHDTTLIVIRDEITELKPIIISHQEYRQLPGVILPEQEEELFYRILATFRRAR